MVKRLGPGNAHVLTSQDHPPSWIHAPIWTSTDGT